MKLFVRFALACVVGLFLCVSPTSAQTVCSATDYLTTPAGDVFLVCPFMGTLTAPSGGSTGGFPSGVNVLVKGRAVSGPTAPASSWTATSNDDWITIAPYGTQTFGASVTKATSQALAVKVAANTSGSARLGSVVVVQGSRVWVVPVNQN